MDAKLNYKGRTKKRDNLGTSRSNKNWIYFEFEAGINMFGFHQKITFCHYSDIYFWDYGTPPP